MAEATGALRHRGPDDAGVWCRPGGAVTLGHRRLSIIDTGPGGHQPMRSADGSSVIVFNGEIYNHRELREQLERLGHRFSSTSDTEVLLEAYVRWGEDMLEKLVGMFAFAVWDERRHRLFLARDRAGEKPLYYADAPAGFAFASELPALRHAPWCGDDIDPDAVALYLEHQYVPAPFTILRGARKLPPAHAAVVDEHGTRLWRYWDPLPFALQGPVELGDDEALEQLEELLRRAVRRQMVADVPLGAFLSGGIDSTAVVALMSELAPGAVRTFTIGFEDEAFDESEHAQRVARHLGTQHTCEVLGERAALELVPQLPATYGEPFADPSALPTRLVAAVARKHVTVSLSGDGGDELFGGYRRYAGFERLAGAERAFGPALALGAPVLRRLPGRVGMLAETLAPGPRSDAYHPFVSALLARDVEALTGRPQPPYGAYSRAWDAGAALPPPRRAMLVDLSTYLSGDVLVKVDRAAMANSLETRAPFLDHHLVEWALRLPDRLVRGKELLRRLAYRKVPRELLERPKKGFGVPLSAWLARDLRDVLEDALEPARLEPFGIVERRAVRRLLDEHRRGRRDRSRELWTLMVLGLWGAGAGPSAVRDGHLGVADGA